MQDTARIGLTAFIWAVVGAVLMTAVTMAGDVTSGVVILSAIGFVFASQTTKSIWRDETETATRAEPIAKRKRGAPNDSTALLLELMDDDERQAFKEALAERMLNRVDRLSDDDGELPVGLADLINEPQERRR